MSLNDSIFESVPGVGILLGGAIAALASARAAFAVAGAGSLLITAAAWLVLSPGPASGAESVPRDAAAPRPAARVESPPGHSRPAV
jgi:hypothetical protein